SGDYRALLRTGMSALRPLGLPQKHNRRPPSAILRMIQAERDDIGMFRENRVNGALKIPDAFAVDNAHLVDTAFQTRGQEFRHQLFDLPRIKRVQIQHAVYWDSDGFGFVQDGKPVARTINWPETLTGMLS